MKEISENFLNYISGANDWQNLLNIPIQGMKPNDVDKLKEALIRMRQHDQYYLIMDLKGNFNITWSFGIQECLGYSESNGESTTWTLEKNIQIVHPYYLRLFYYFGMASYEILMSAYKDLAPGGQGLMERHVMNIPVQKANGAFVWVKKMSMPLCVDDNGRMTQQLNAYTIIAPYDNIFLPIDTRLFDSNGKRRRAHERMIYERANQLLGIAFDTTQETIISLFIRKYEEKKASHKYQSLDVTHQEIAEISKTYSQSYLKKKASETIKYVEKQTGVRFPNFTQLAKFYRPLFFVEK